MKDAAYIMSKACRIAAWNLLLCAAVAGGAARGESPTEHIVTRVSAEVLETPTGAPGASQPGGVVPDVAVAKLKTAQRVVPGDVLIYTVEVRNTGRYAAESALVIQRVPNHTMYLADTAVGPGVDVDYSIDGGRTFDKPENLKSPGSVNAGAVAAAGAPRANAMRATAAEYTHIRWRLHNRLKPNSVAYVRFRAQVK